MPIREETQQKAREFEALRSSTHRKRCAKKVMRPARSQWQSSRMSRRRCSSNATTGLLAAAAVAAAAATASSSPTNTSLSTTAFSRRAVLIRAPSSAGAAAVLRGPLGRALRSSRKAASWSACDAAAAARRMPLEATFASAERVQDALVEEGLVRNQVHDAVPPARRRPWLTVAASLAGMATMATGPRPAEAGVKPACGNVDECREIGDRRRDEREKALGPIVEIRKGFRYREAAVGVGPEVKQGDLVDITYEVRKTNGDYIYSLGRGRPDMGPNDLGETYRVRLGNLDVPKAVEYAMVGMRPGGVRAIQMPPRIGFETSDWRPEPTNFSGQRRMERFRNLLYGNGLTKGYDAAIIFEVQVVRIRESSDSAVQTSKLASATPAAAS